MVSCPDVFRILTSTAGGVTRVAVFGDVDAATAPELDAALVEASASECDEVILDFRGLRFIDSSGLSVLVTGHKRLRETERDLVVESLPVTARRLFDISGLDRVLTIRE